MLFRPSDNPAYFATLKSGITKALQPSAIIYSVLQNGTTQSVTLATHDIQQFSLNTVGDFITLTQPKQSARIILTESGKAKYLSAIDTANTVRMYIQLYVLEPASNTNVKLATLYYKDYIQDSNNTLSLNFVDFTQLYDNKIVDYSYYHFANGTNVASGVLGALAIYTYYYYGKEEAIDDWFDYKDFGITNSVSNFDKPGKFFPKLYKSLCALVRDANSPTTQRKYFSANFTNSGKLAIYEVDIELNTSYKSANTQYSLYTDYTIEPGIIKQTILPYNSLSTQKTVEANVPYINIVNETSNKVTFTLNTVQTNKVYVFMLPRTFDIANVSVSPSNAMSIPVIPTMHNSKILIGLGNFSNVTVTVNLGVFVDTYNVTFATQSLSQDKYLLDIQSPVASGNITTQQIQTWLEDMSDCINEVEKVDIATKVILPLEVNDVVQIPLGNTYRYARLRESNVTIGNGVEKMQCKFRLGKIVDQAQYSVQPGKKLASISFNTYGAYSLQQGSTLSQGTFLVTANLMIKDTYTNGTIDRATLISILKDNNNIIGNVQVQYLGDAWNNFYKDNLPTQLKYYEEIDTIALVGLGDAQDFKTTAYLSYCLSTLQQGQGNYKYSIVIDQNNLTQYKVLYGITNVFLASQTFTDFYSFLYAKGFNKANGLPISCAYDSQSDTILNYLFYDSLYQGQVRGSVQNKTTGTTQDVTIDISSLFTVDPNVEFQGSTSTLEHPIAVYSYRGYGTIQDL